MMETGGTMLNQAAQYNTSDAVFRPLCKLTSRLAAMMILDL